MPKPFKPTATIRSFGGECVAPINFDHNRVRIVVGEGIEQWIDIEIRHGRVMIRGGRPVSIHPDVSNAFYVEVETP